MSRVAWHGCRDGRTGAEAGTRDRSRETVMTHRPCTIDDTYILFMYFVELF